MIGLIFLILAFIAVKAYMDATYMTRMEAKRLRKRDREERRKKRAEKRSHRPMPTGWTD